MRKIYSPPFNKFAIFVLYGLLSIAEIALAQSGAQCGMRPYEYATMGYINLNSPNIADTIQSIPWKSYNYINVIAYPIQGSLWNSFRYYDGTDLSSLDTLVANRKAKNPNAKIFLSIRNYDPKNWPTPDDGTVEAVYAGIVSETVKNIKILDGVDIEYPGMRGIYCGGWDEGDRDGKDERFIKFLGDLKGQIPEKKLMLTVGKDVPKHAADLKNYIDFLNIETHHFSIYENLKHPPNDAKYPDGITSYPNAPFTEFANAYNAWFKPGIGIDKEKIIMGLDFGNTFQVVDNPDIEEGNQSVNTTPLDINVVQDPVIGLTKPINIKLCSDPNLLDTKLHLYSFPWKDLSKSVLDLTKCKTAKSDWNYVADEDPWLYKTVGVPNMAQYYLYVSFEDFTSLNTKLEFAKDKVGGISISDVSYDDESGSLLNFIRGKILPLPTGTNPDQGKNSTSSTTKTTSTDPETQTQGEPTETPVPPEPKPKPGIIVGAIFGSLFGLFIIGGGLFWYRNRNRPKSSSFKSLLNFKSISSRNHNPGNEMTSDPSPNRFAVPSTTVIPVASGYVTAMFDFTGKEENDLSFKKGDKIEILERGDGPNDWWVGRVNGAVGEFPGNYVKET